MSTTGIHLCVVTLGWAGFLTAGLAQGVLAPPPPSFSPNAPGVLAGGSDQVANLGSALDSAGLRLLQWGPVHLRPHLLFRFSYSDGIQSQPGQPSTSTINEVSPGVLFEMGRHWTLDYTPTLRFFSNPSFRDTTDQSVSLNGATTYQDWSFGLSQRYVSSSTPLVETGSQTDQETYTTTVNAAYHVNTDLSLELGVNQNFRFVGAASQATNSLNDSLASWSTMDWLNYTFWPGFGAAIGVGFGYDDVSVGSDMTYEQLQGRINWRAGDKLSFSFNGGLEVRQFLDSAVPELFNPLFGMSLQYKLFEVTTISLNANRTVSSSYFQNQVTETSSVGASIQQRLLGKLHLVVGGGYANTSYKASSAVLPVQREDNNTFFDVRLTAPFSRRGTLSVFYRASDNSSSKPGLTYSSVQMGLELGYQF